MERADVHYMVNGLLRTDWLEGESVKISRDPFCTVIVVEKGRIIKSTFRPPTDFLAKFELNYSKLEITFHRMMVEGNDPSPL